MSARSNFTFIARATWVDAVVISVMSKKTEMKELLEAALAVADGHLTEPFTA